LSCLKSFSTAAENATSYSELNRKHIIKSWPPNEKLR